jgi:hypothetical protein
MIHVCTYTLIRLRQRSILPAWKRYPIPGLITFAPLIDWPTFYLVDAPLLSALASAGWLGGLLLELALEGRISTRGSPGQVTV